MSLTQSAYNGKITSIALRKVNAVCLNSGGTELGTKARCSCVLTVTFQDGSAALPAAVTSQENQSSACKPRPSAAVGPVI